MSLEKTLPSKQKIVYFLFGVDLAPINDDYKVAYTFITLKALFDGQSKQSRF